MDQSPLRPHLDRQDWGEIYLRLYDFAEHRCKSASQAKDLAQEAIGRVFAYDSGWDPAKEPNVLRYLMSVVNSLLANERRSHAATRTSSLEDPRAARAARAALRVPDPRAPSENQIADQDLLT